MEDKEFKKVVIRYIINIAIIFAMVIVLVLSSNGVLPEIFQMIGAVILVANCLAFTFFMKKYKK